MIYAQDQKTLVLFHADAVATNADTTAAVDTLSYDYLTVDVILDTVAAVSCVCTTMQLSESDDSTTYTTIAAMTGGTATSATVGFVIVAGSTSVDQSYVLGLDLRARKRYIKLTARQSGTASALASAMAHLSKAEESTQTVGGAAETAITNSVVYAFG